MIKLCHGKERMPNDVNEAWKLKRYLGLKRTEKISLSKMGEIEDAYKININVMGDHKYKSPMKYKHTRTYEIVLINGHYDLLHDRVR